MAARSDGTNYLQITLPAGLTTPTTLLCWFLSENDDSGQIPIVELSETSGNHWMKVSRGDLGINVFGFEQSIRAGPIGFERTALSGALSLSDWHSAVARFVSDSDITLHTDDGTPVSNTDTQPVPDNCTVLTLFANRDGTNILPVGNNLARVCVVDRDLTLVTPDEVAAFAAGGWPPAIFGADLIRFYDFPEGDDFLVDWEGNNPLTEVGEGTGITHVADPAGFNYGGKIFGSTSFGFTATGTLRHLAPIAGTAELTFTATGDMTPGTISGTAPVDFTPVGTLTGKGALAGVASLAFTASASFAAPGTLAGAITFGFDCIADPFEGVDRGTLTGKGALAGVADLSFSLSGVFVPNAMEGSTALDFTSTAVMRAKGQLSGSSSAAFAATGSLVNRHAVGVAAFGFAGTATLTAKGALAGSSGLSFVASVDRGGVPRGRHRWPTHTQVGLFQ